MYKLRKFRPSHQQSFLKHNVIKDEESNGELAFLDILWKGCNGKTSVLVYRKPAHIDQYLHYRHCLKMKFFINDFFSKCEQIRRKL